MSLFWCLKGQVCDSKDVWVALRNFFYRFDGAKIDLLLPCYLVDLLLCDYTRWLDEVYLDQLCVKPSHFFFYGRLYTDLKLVIVQCRILRCDY